MWYIILAFA
ncbi:UNVERIFIED_CONTAM: hypothetical protein GTU68_029615 [Idotea baltica]|nr:hypothetical protein [Idotea baltica]